MYEAKFPCSQLFQQLPHTFHAKGCLEWLPSQRLDPHAPLSEAVSHHVRAADNQVNVKSVDLRFQSNAWIQGCANDEQKHR